MDLTNSLYTGVPVYLVDSVLTLPFFMLLEAEKRYSWYSLSRFWGSKTNRNSMKTNLELLQDSHTWLGHSSIDAHTKTASEQDTNHCYSEMNMLALIF